MGNTNCETFVIVKLNLTKSDHFQQCLKYSSHQFSNANKSSRNCWTKRQEKICHRQIWYRKTGDNCWQYWLEITEELRGRIDRHKGMMNTVNQGWWAWGFMILLWSCNMMLFDVVQDRHFIRLITVISFLFTTYTINNIYGKFCSTTNVFADKLHVCYRMQKHAFEHQCLLI